jgi:Skp family chaperone for outer membrane proteins
MPLALLGLLNNPVVKALLMAAAAASAIFAFAAYERHVGAAKVRAQYEAAAAAESARQMKSLEATQKRIALLTAELSKTKRSRDAMVQQNDTLARTLAGRSCLDAGVVRQLDRVR